MQGQQQLAILEEIALVQLFAGSIFLTITSVDEMPMLISSAMLCGSTCAVMQLAKMLYICSRPVLPSLRLVFCLQTRMVGIFDRLVLEAWIVSCALFSWWRSWMSQVDLALLAHNTWDYEDRRLFVVLQIEMVALVHVAELLLQNDSVG